MQPFGADTVVVHQNSFNEDFIKEPHTTNNHFVEESGYYLT